MLQSLTSPKANNNNRKRKREKQEAEPLNPEHLLYIVSETESTSGEDDELNEGNTPVPPPSLRSAHEVDQEIKSKKPKQDSSGKLTSNPVSSISIGKSTTPQRWKGKSKMKQTQQETDDSSLIAKETKDHLPEGWNGQEVTLFRMLHPIFGHNYCAIAEIISSKTCHQVKLLLWYRSTCITVCLISSTSIHAVYCQTHHYTRDHHDY